jgi:ATP-dependent DNA helicase RecG
MPTGRRNESELLEAAILKKKSDDFEGAHHLLTEAYALNPNNAKTVHELAQTKSRLARNLNHKRQPGHRHRFDPETEALRKKLLQDCEGLLRRALQLTDDKIRLAWCWHDLAWALVNLKQPENDIEQAFLSARALAPYEQRIEDAYRSWKYRRNRAPRPPRRPGR